ncbi:DUF4194 domain-containing protein [Paeniglutamicibacter sp.]|uniref:DUF4194 domain-containing protein n=1 Tax=Paeniglutamicibacter sp. TaxID=1934391 RepID=UPI003989C78A
MTSDPIGNEATEQAQALAEFTADLAVGEVPDCSQNDLGTPGEQLFEGDRGELTLAQRKALIVLLKRKYLSADKYPQEWQALLTNRISIEIRLNELFLELVLDEDRQFAYKRGAVPEGEGRFPTLLHNRQYTLEETVLLVELRDRFAREWASGSDNVFVDREELLHYLESNRRTDGTNHVETRRRETNAITGLNDEGVLIAVQGDADRFRISPVISAVLTVEKLRELMQWITNDLEGVPE